MTIKEFLEYVLNATLLLALAIIGIGLGSLGMKIMRKYAVPGEVELAFIRLLLMIFACIAAKMLSRMNEYSIALLKM